jgi:hypothetical protein
MSRDAHDGIVGIMLQISLLVHRQRRAVSLSMTETETTDLGRLQHALRDEISSRYKAWLQVLAEDQDLAFGVVPLYAAQQYSCQPPGYFPQDLPLPLKKQFPAMALAYFHAALILLTYHFPPTGSSADLDVDWNIRWIMAAGEYLSQSAETNATAILRMSLCFGVVWKCCQHSGIVQDARALFTEWCMREGMLGLVVIAFNNQNTTKR